VTVTIGTGGAFEYSFAQAEAAKVAEMAQA